MTGNPPKPDDWGHDPFNVTGKYLLKYRKPVPCPDLMKWGKIMQMHNRKKRVRHTYIGSYKVSTVFLYISHGLDDDSKPLLFESMVFAENEEDALNYFCERTTTWRKALKQHWDMVEKVKHEQV